jgi:hypothetical protein
MKRQQLNLEATRELHQQIAEITSRDPERARRALEVSNRELSERRLTFGDVKPLEASLTALLLNKGDEAVLARTAESLHAVVERVLEHVVASPVRFEKFLPEHQRVLPYLSKTAGHSAWQVASRYDMAVTEDGSLKLLELNTSCPGGFMISQAMSEATRHGLAELGSPIDGKLARWQRNATIPANVLAEELLALEASANVPRETIAVLNDENDLVFELDLVVDSLRRHNRQVVFTDAACLRFKGDQLIYDDQVISLTYNKFRVSTPQSPNHCWREGFEQRYAAFLAAQQNGNVVSVNNLGGMALAEDKSFLAAFVDPEIRELLSTDERLLVDEHLLWTARLQKGPVILDGGEADLVPYVRANRERFVIKPANEGRGYGVVVGKFAGDKEWATACTLDPKVPKIVQEFTESITLPVVSAAHEPAQGSGVPPLYGTRPTSEPLVREMFLTLGLTLIRGRYRGLVSRVSANPVTNVAREGFGQAAYLRD